MSAAALTLGWLAYRVGRIEPELRIFMRGYWTALLLSAALLVPLAGCGGSTETKPASGSFVGSVSGSDALVAVIATSPKANTKVRDVKVYVCNSDGINEWLPGRAKGNAFSVTSAKGARAQVKLDSDIATGTITLAGGRTLDFKAGRATGIAGLYNATSTADGRVTGTSDRGAQLAGRVTTKVVRSLRGQALYAAKITITPAGGRPTRYTSAWLKAGSGAGSERIVVLASGTVRGGTKFKTTTSSEPLGRFDKSIIN